MDETEGIRRVLISEVNSQIESNDEDSERVRLETEYGQAWNTEEVGKDFMVVGFMAPFVVAIRKSDGVRGSLHFQDRPRFYFNFIPE